MDDQNTKAEPHPISCRIVEGGYFFHFDDGTTKFIRHCASFEPDEENDDDEKPSTQI